MQGVEFKICKGCGKNRPIQNKWLCLCRECVYKKNHEGKSQQQVLKKKSSYKRKDTGEKEMFLEIWKTRPHYCINCGKFLGDVPKASFFSHRVAKSVDRNLRLDPDNVDLLCPDCHYARDFRGKQAYEERSVNG